MLVIFEFLCYIKFIMEERFKHLNNYLKEKFGERTLKICIDGGFTCPNRDGTCGYGGCIYCSEKGSGELINNKKRLLLQLSNKMKKEVKKHLPLQMFILKKKLHQKLKEEKSTFS